MKNELLERLGASRDELLRAASDLTEEQLAAPGVVGNWSVRDVVGHVGYWEKVIHDHVRQSFSEGRPRPLKSDPAEDAINRRESDRRKSWPWPRVRAEFEDGRAALIERVQGIAEAELSIQVPCPWWGEQRFYSVGEMIDEDAVGHCREHVQQIVAWRARGA
jgi:uncharacterized protein (TIGR03083 family)